VTEESVFAAALQIGSPAERAAFLDRACAGNSTLRREVEDLLAAHAADNPLDQPPVDLARTGAYETECNGPPPAAAGDRIGPYRLMEQIGEGGFGLVFVAEQSEPVRRKVALKVLKPGMDTRDVVARFEAERQALALMDHPNIAKVLDAGSTESGRPYFVMELVRGLPITDYCDQNKLAPRDRLALFVQVCAAVQHAHQKGVIHRDLKPGNILVASHDGVPVPKVIDFGVAKAVGQSLTEKTIYTRFAQMIGTPLYMSPEQAEMSGLDLDTRADVYALGVVLYELLTGTTPFDRDRFRKAAFDEIRRIIREEEPPRPSTRLSSLGATLTGVSASRGTDPGKLTGLVRGELDWIVMKCLEKDRNRRYETASGLAKDVQRHLDGDAVEACPPTLGYRLRKAYRKNKTAGFLTLFVAACLVAVLLNRYFASLDYLDERDRARAAEAEAVAARNAEAEQRDETARQRDAAVVAGKETTQQRDETQKALGKLRLAQEEQHANQYVWDMQLLPLAFEANNAAEVKRLLDRHVPTAGQTDRRGFEWYYWDRQLRADLRTDQLPDSARQPGSWAASPDGSRVAVLTIPGYGGGNWGVPKDESAVLTVWDVAARKMLVKHKMPPPVPEEQGASKSVFRPIFSRDGKWVLASWGAGLIATGGGTGMSPRHRQVIDAATGRVAVQLDGNVLAFPRFRTDNHAAFSPDGRRFVAVEAVAGDGRGIPAVGRARVWDLESGKEVCDPLNADDVAENPFSPDGTRLVTARNAYPTRKTPTRVSVWDLSTGREAAGWDVPDAILHALAASPDGKLVAGVSGGQIAVGKGEVTHPGARTIKVWEAAAGKELHTLPLARLPGTGTQLVWAFFSPDGSRLAVERQQSDWGAGTRSSDLTLWDPVGGKPLPPPAGLVDDSAARGLSGPNFSPDGKQILSAKGGALRTWDVDTGRPVLALRGHLAPIEARAYTADGKRLWSLDSNGVLKEWDARPPGRVTIPVAASPGPAAAFSTFAISPDGGRVATLAEVKKDQQSLRATLAVRVWDTTGKPVKLLVPEPREASPKSRATTYGLALSRGGRRAALTRNDTGWVVKEPADSRPADLTAWDVETGAVLLRQTLDGRARPSPAISPDGRLLAVVTRPNAEADAHVVRVLDLDAGRERPPLALPDTRGVAGASFSPDGRHLAVMTTSAEAVTSGGKVVVWDVEDGKQLSALDVQSSARLVGEFATRFAWSPDGSRFAFSRDPANGARIEVHDTATGRTLVKLDQPVSEDGGASLVPSLAYSPDGKRIAAFLPPQTMWGARVVQVWDAASGKELLTLRPTQDGMAQGSRRLAFAGDGRHLLFAEVVTETDPTREGGRSRQFGSPGTETVTRSLVLTTWDATPLPRRDPERP
jgi:serine/threonine protein kinase/WD40 repeat protein